ncbi:protein of unknown function [Tenacibaculum mesophilum]|uniref:DUF1837 domain-containing protein n=1 Tax=Tenacibaculum mesophilum TaxID=104268 RepID=A0ABN5T3L6_9FLAO|nr:MULTISPECIES: DUF1837 domain-containing protein [Flavobacteriaceae]AZJ31786.1 DUF1837 domain-containing protein [Tenacibaculum mesophilum]QFS27040.1 DUF1837 domain-containing protein [Tenacibaculum mesophilum]TXK76884.1 DUF1837 domain-containing protein [Mesonia sp. K4-1]SHF83598.1 protein of unknown function [Tenacibaculum mesophilum]
MNLQFLKLLYHTNEVPIGMTGLCCGFEAGEWRHKQFSEFLFDRHLLDFALKFSEYENLNYLDATNKLKKAAKLIYQKYHSRRGEFGELILHSIIKECYNTTPAISKIHFKDGPNETVKGFDAVHVLEVDNQLELWLGEVKFYSNISNAIRDVVPEIKDHLENNYLRNEFIAITNKIDEKFPLKDKLKKLIDPYTSLDEIFSSISVPVLLTYNSNTTKDITKFTDEYIDKIKPELEKIFEAFKDKIGDIDLKIHLFLLPMKEKIELTASLDERLNVWQNL